MGEENGRNKYEDLGLFYWNRRVLNCLKTVKILQTLEINVIDIGCRGCYSKLRKVIDVNNNVYRKETNMLVSKNIQIEFADPSIKAADAIHDIRAGVRSASLNLYSRYDVQIQTPVLCDRDKVVVEIKIPEEMVETFSIGPHLKGIANYLLKNCNGRYEHYVVGKRLLVYTEVASPKAADHRFPMENRLDAVAQFAKLLERSDEEAMDAISHILVILKNVENKIIGL